MKNKIMLSITLFLATSIVSFSQTPRTITISSSELDTKITINGKVVGEGQAVYKITGGSCANITFEKTGYLTKTVSICNKKKETSVPKTYHQQMERDDSFDASVKADIANRDIEFTSTKTEEEAWKVISQIVLNYFDVIEVTDRSTGYMRTSWVIKNYKSNTIRTRIIVKQSSSDPLKYKVKICSEASGSSGTSSRDEELFKEWDRVIKAYEELIEEFQIRL